MTDRQTSADFRKETRHNFEDLGVWSFCVGSFCTLISFSLISVLGMHVQEKKQLLEPIAKVSPAGSFFLESFKACDANSYFRSSGCISEALVSVMNTFGGNETEAVADMLGPYKAYEFPESEQLLLETLTLHAWLE